LSRELLLTARSLAPYPHLLHRETYVEIPSDKCPFNEKPDMKTREITEAGIAALKSGKYDLLRINYASPDMVGHTGSLEATIRACETCDECLGELLAEVDKLGGVYLVCSDHGNADDMVQVRFEG